MTSDFLSLAARDFKGALRSRMMWGATILLGFMYLPSAHTVATNPYRPRPVGEFLVATPYELLTYSLIVVAAVGYNAISGEQTNGTLRFLVTLSGERRDLVLGKFVSRAGMAIVSTTIVLLIGNVVVINAYGRGYFLAYWVMSACVLLYVVAWSAVAIGYSAAFVSPYRSLFAFVGTYAVFSSDTDVWSIVVRPVFSLLFTGSTSPPVHDSLAAAPMWLRVVDRFNPVIGFFEATKWVVHSVGPGSPSGGPILNAFGILVLVAFGVIPLWSGYWRFLGRDLGGAPNSGPPAWARYFPDTLSVRLDRRVPDWGSTQFRALFRQDIRGITRDWTAVGSVMLLVILVFPRLFQRVRPSDISTPAQKIMGLQSVFLLPLLVLGVSFGYRAIVHERDGDTIRILLGLPTTRGEVYLAKLASRTTATVLVLAPLLILLEILILARFGRPHPFLFLAIVGIVVPFAVFWTLLSTVVSAVTSSAYRSLAAVAGLYLSLTDLGLWGVAVRPLIVSAFGGSGSSIRDVAGNAPVALYLDNLNPVTAMTTLQNGIVGTVGGTAPDVSASLFLYSSLTVATATGLALYVGYRSFEKTSL